MLMMLQLKSLKMQMEISRKKKRFKTEKTVAILREEVETIEEMENIEVMIEAMIEEAESIEIEEATMKKEVIEVITEVTEVITREEDPIPATRSLLTKMMKVSMLSKTRTTKTEVEEDPEETTEEEKEEIEAETSREEVKAEASIEAEVEAEMVKAPEEEIEEIEAEEAEEEEKDHQESKPTQMKRVQELVLPLQILFSSEEN